MHSNYLKTDGFDGPNGTGDDFVAGGRGMFGVCVLCSVCVIRDMIYITNMCVYVMCVM